MKENIEKFKQFVIEQLKDYDEWREASPDGYAEIITDEAVKLFRQPAVSNQRELLCAFFKFFRDNGEANIGMTIEQFVDTFLSTQ